MDERLLGILADSFPKILLPGLMVTIPLTVLAFSLAMAIAVAAALVQFARVPVLTQLCRFYIWVFRGTPLLVQLFVVFFGMPRIGITIEPFPAAVIVFSLNEGAYCAEIVRAALESVPAGQLEAGYWQASNRVKLTQSINNRQPQFLAAAGYLHSDCTESFQGRQASAGTPRGRFSRRNLRYGKGRRPLALAVSTME